MSLVQHQPIYTTEIVQLPEERHKSRRDCGINIHQDQRRDCMQSVLHPVDMVVNPIGNALFTAASDEILPEGDQWDDDHGDLCGRQSRQGEIQGCLPTAGRHNNHRLRYGTRQ